MMENKRSLLKVTQTIQHATGELAKLKEIIDLEMKMLDAEELSDKQLVVNFLNSLPSKQGGLMEFVSTHYVYFLLKNCTLDPQFLDCTAENRDSVRKALDVARRAHAALSQITCDIYGCRGSGLLSNQNLLSELEFFLNWVEKVAAGLTPLSSIPRSPVQTFLCVEQIIALLYLDKLYTTIPEVKFHLPNFERMSTLEQWTLALYTSTVGLPTGGQALPGVSELACSLILHDQDLFISPNAVTHSLLTFPFAKKRANLIFQTYLNNPQANITESSPLLQIREVDLLHLDTSFFFLYDYIFEALSNNQPYGCSMKAVNGFIDRAVGSLTDLGANLWEASSTSKDPASNIDAFKGFLLRAGLTEKHCADFRTLLLLNKSNNAPRWPRFGELLHLVSQLTLTAHYFYACLQQYSPTSIAHYRISETLKLAAAEQLANEQTNRDKQQKTKPFHWTITNILAFFVPHPPLSLIQDISDHITSPYMRSYFWISLHRIWQITPCPAAQLLHPVTPVIGPAGTDEDAKKYCEGIQIGETSYQAHLVRTEAFEQAFILTKAFPILQKLIGMEIHVHRAMCHLRWLITFAADAPPFLNRLRHPLILLYFQISDIMSQNRVDTSFKHLLDYTQSVLEVLRETVPKAELPTNLLTYLFLAHFSSSLSMLLATVNDFVQESNTLAESVASLARVGATLCHSVFHFNPKLDTIEFPITGDSGEEVFRISTPAFKSTISALQQSCFDVIVLLNESSRELHASYLDLLVLSADVSSLRNHPIQFDRSELNFKKTSDYFVKCFSLQHRLTNSILSTCCYSLTRRFAALFEPDLISLDIIKQILDFPSSGHNPQIFLAGISQPTDTVPSRSPHGPVVKLTRQEVIEIRDLAPDFIQSPNSSEAAPVAIKQNFTGTFDKVSIDVDPSTLTAEFATPNIKAELEALEAYKIVFVKDLLEPTQELLTPA
ncbi:tegument protein-like protein [Ovine gammaherpesvirus 2]|uniref:Tegument protein-like protein n=1 Tax=Ovine gammaherpesvirus 2 TaxID=10398 RepID=A1BM53_9GAMA|nr:tegument protein-like protein [Ovine gammaherpesvirus 2]